MPSPVGHCLIGLGSAQLVHRGRTRLILLAVILITAIAPDFDFIPGLLIGDINRFHHGPSHSIGFALAYALLGALLLRFNSDFRHFRSTFTLLLVVYLSHLLADLMSVDHGAPYGIPLLWPISDQYLISPVSLFMKIEHGPYGGDTATVMANIFSWHNLIAVTVEFIVAAPLLWLCQRRRDT